MRIEENIPQITIFLSCIASISLIVAFVKFRKLINSLDEISKIFTRVSNNNFSERLHIRYDNELRKFSLHINKMIASLQDRDSKIRNIQLELQKQNKDLNAILNSLSDGIITISKTGEIIRTNPTICSWTGLKEEELKGKKFNEFLKCNCDLDCLNEENFPQNCSLFVKNHDRIVTEAEITNIVTGEKRFLSIEISEISGILIEQHYVIALRDITESKEIEKLREDFSATLAHDLKVPIIAESNTLSFFLRGIFGEISEKQKEALENMIESNNDLLNLVNTLIDVYKYDAVQIKFRKEPADIKKLVDICLSEVSSLVHKYNHIVENNVLGNLPLVSMDKPEIKRVILNILNNAITYTQPGGIISVYSEVNENEVIIKIKDNGKGISQSEIDKIFDRYFSKAMKFRKVGTGLGLYLAKKIIEGHNGRIWAESEPDKGSIFYFSLPLAHIPE